MRGPDDAPPPARGDLLNLTLDDGHDAEFEVTKVAREPDGWWASCERKRPPGGGEDD